MLTFALLAVCLVLLVIDYGQTRDIRYHPELKEKNPILGEHPSDRAIITYFAVWVFVVGVLVVVPWGWIGIAVVGVIEAVVVYLNYRLGLKVRVKG